MAGMWGDIWGDVWDESLFEPSPSIWDDIWGDIWAAIWAEATDEQSSAYPQLGVIWAEGIWNTTIWNTNIWAPAAGPATLTNLTVSPGATAALVTLYTNRGSGRIYFYVSKNPTPPSAPALKAGTGAIWSGSMVPVVSGRQSITVGNLTPLDTGYYVHALQVTSEDSEIYTSEAFATVSIDAARLVTVFVPHGVPEDAVYRAGIAYAQTGAMYVCDMPVDDAASFLAGRAVRADGALVINSVAEIEEHLGGIGLTQIGETAVTELEPHLVHQGKPLQQDGRLSVTDADGIA